MASSSLPRLQYFAFRGRALASRVALYNALGKDGWVDERVSLPKFQKMKPFPMPSTPASRTTELDFITNNLPQLTLACGKKVSQSHAIARYAAKLAAITTKSSSNDKNPHAMYSLYPEDLEKALLVDEAVAVIDQILLLTPKDEDAAMRARNREAFYKTGFLRIGMELLESRLSQSRQEGPFLLGKELTIADLYIRAPLGDLFDLKQFEGVPDNFYSQFPLVKACAAAVLEHPLLKAYHEHYKN